MSCYRCKRDEDMTYRGRSVCQRCWEWICEQIDAGRRDRIAKAFNIKFDDARRVAPSTPAASAPPSLADLDPAPPSIDDTL